MVQRLTQSERRNQTRRRLLDGARAVFGRRGFGAATLDEIAETAGLTRGALYYNFPEGKDELFLALLDERVAERAGAVERAFAGEGTHDVAQTVNQARSAAGDFAHGMRANREWRLLLFEFALHAARERRFARRFATREHALRKALVHVIEDRTRELGIDPPLPPEQIAIGITALGNGLALEELVREGNVDEKLFEDLVAFLVLGMATAARGRASP